MSLYHAGICLLQELHEGGSVPMSFNAILEKHRKLAFSEADKGRRFERLMQGFLRTEPFYEKLFQTGWLWNEFPYFPTGIQPHLL